MRIFITGATGYVGSNLIPRLKRDGHELTCLLRSPEKHTENALFVNCKRIKGDLTDRNSIEGCCKGMDIVIHLAAATPVNNPGTDESIYDNTNVIGTRNLLEECNIAKPKRIICFSSTAAIGRPVVDFIDEKTPLTPVNDYGRSKKESEALMSLYVKENGLPIITLCFPHIYGPGDTHELLKIATLMKKGLFPQIGFGPNLLPMIYISDAVEAIVLAMRGGNIGEKYIIADKDPHDTRKLRSLVLSAIGVKKRLYPFIPKYFGIVGAYFIEQFLTRIGLKPPITCNNIRSIAAARRLSINKAAQELGFKPSIEFEDGVKNTILWYKENQLI